VFFFIFDSPEEYEDALKGHHYLRGAEQLESAQEEHAASAKRSCNDKGVKVICICCK
jgi:hypothetical protein